MRTKLVVLVVALTLAFAVQAEEVAWFDMEKCAFCKHLLEDPEMLEHCTWEHHKVESGVITVTTVEPEYLASYEKAMHNMEETGKQMESGQMVQMCGMCNAMGALMMKGAKWEHAKTKHGSVQLFTSADPEMVKEIHAFADRTNDELAKWEAATEKGEIE